MLFCFPLRNILSYYRQWTIPTVLLCGLVNTVIGNDVHLLTDRKQISKIISDLIASELYESALQLADSIENAESNDPFGALLRATVLNSRAIDFEDGEDDLNLEQACKDVENLANLYFVDKDSSLVYRFYMGTVAMYRMLVQVKRGSYLKAFRGIRRAGKLFDEAVKIDSTFWDAYYGAGVYTYYRSSRAGLLRKLHLVSDNRSQGIMYIEKSAELGTITSLASQNTLAWIAIEREEYEYSLQLSSRLSSQYPTTRAFWWCMGSALKKLKRWEEVISVYAKLLNSVQNERRNNYFNEVGCLHSLAQANFELQNWNRVIVLTDSALKLRLNNNVAKRKKADLSRMKKMKAKALAKLDSN